jgi:signal peptidase
MSSGEEMTNRLSMGSPSVLTRTISGEKTWDFSQDESMVSMTPGQITLSLWGDGELVWEFDVTPDAGGEWRYSLEVPVYGADGVTPVEYSISEEELDDFDTVVNGFDVTNVWSVEDRDPDEPIDPDDPDGPDEPDDPDEPVGPDVPGDGGGGEPGGGGDGGRGGGGGAPQTGDWVRELCAWVIWLPVLAMLCFLAAWCNKRRQRAYELQAGKDAGGSEGEGDEGEKPGLLRIESTAEATLGVPAAGESEPDSEPVVGRGRGRCLLGKVLSVLLVAVCSFAVFGIVQSKASGGGQPGIFGYSTFTVLTSSMQDTLPRGSLLVDKHVDPQSLVVGDDITYVIEGGATITHRIIEINENADGYGNRSFTTKGTMNNDPDVKPVYAPNVAGKVIFHVPYVGTAVQMMRANIAVTVVMAVLFFALIESILVLLRRRT